MQGLACRLLLVPMRSFGDVGSGREAGGLGAKWGKWGLSLKLRDFWDFVL